MRRTRTLAMAASVMVLLLSACGPGDILSGEVVEEDDAVDPNEPDPWSEAQGTIGEGESDREISSCTQKSGMYNGNYTRLSYASVAKLAHGVGIPCGYSLVKAVAVAAAESGRYQYAYLRNKGCSIDRGMWQINSVYHPSYSTFDLNLNAKGMVSISKRGTNWQPWYGYTKGGWKSYLGSACAAVKSICGKSGC